MRCDQWWQFVNSTKPLVYQYEYDENILFWNQAQISISTKLEEEQVSTRNSTLF